MSLKIITAPPVKEVDIAAYMASLGREPKPIITHASLPQLPLTPKTLDEAVKSWRWDSFESMGFAPRDEPIEWISGNSSLPDTKADNPNSNTYWSSLALFLYGHAELWFWVKAQHLSFFESVLRDRSHPRYELYTRLREMSVEQPLVLNRPSNVTLWRSLGTPDLATRHELIAQVTADLYSVFLVVLVFRGKVAEGHAEEANVEGTRLIEIIARGSYNEPHRILCFDEEKGLYLPLVPRQGRASEFRVPEINLAHTSGGFMGLTTSPHLSAEQHDGPRHPWRMPLEEVFVPPPIVPRTLVPVPEDRHLAQVLWVQFEGQPSWHPLKTPPSTPETVKGGLNPRLVDSTQGTPDNVTVTVSPPVGEAIEKGVAAPLKGDGPAFQDPVTIGVETPPETPVRAASKAMKIIDFDKMTLPQLRRECDEYKIELTEKELDLDRREQKKVRAEKLKKYFEEQGERTIFGGFKRSLEKKARLLEVIDFGRMTLPQLRRKCEELKIELTEEELGLDKQEQKKLRTAKLKHNEEHPNPTQKEDPNFLKSAKRTLEPKELEDCYYTPRGPDIPLNRWLLDDLVNPPEPPNIVIFDNTATEHKDRWETSGKILQQVYTTTTTRTVTSVLPAQRRIPRLPAPQEAMITNYHEIHLNSDYWLEELLKSHELPVLQDRQANIDAYKKYHIKNFAMPEIYPNNPEYIRSLDSGYGILPRIVEPESDGSVMQVGPFDQPLEEGGFGRGTVGPGGNTASRWNAINEPGGANKAPPVYLQDNIKNSDDAISIAKSQSGHIKAPGLIEEDETSDKKPREWIERAWYMKDAVTKKEIIEHCKKIGIPLSTKLKRKKKGEFLPEVRQILKAWENEQKEQKGKRDPQREEWGKRETEKSKKIEKAEDKKAEKQKQKERDKISGRGVTDANKGQQQSQQQEQADLGNGFALENDQRKEQAKEFQEENESFARESGLKEKSEMKRKAKSEPSMAAVLEAPPMKKVKTNSEDPQT